MLVNLVEKLKNKGLEFTSDKYKGGSKQTQKDLAIDILETLFFDYEIVKYQKRFINQRKIEKINI
jgi:hypothetical protein